MPSIQRVLAVGLLPVIALIALQVWDLSAAQRLLQYISPTTGVPRHELPIFVACLAHFSHIVRLTTISSALIDLGYPVTFITGSEFQRKVEATGAKFEALDGPAGMATEEDMQTFSSLPPEDGELFITDKVLVQSIPHMSSTVHRLFDNFRNEHGQDKPLIFVHDINIMALAPVQLGSETGRLPDASIGIGVQPLTVESNDTYPFRDGRAPDTSTRSKEIHFEALQKQKQEALYFGLHQKWESKLLEMGAKPPFPTMWHAQGSLPDYLLQIGIPEFEWYRSDLRPDVGYVGCLNKPGIAYDNVELPDWWADVEKARKEGKKIVAVTQGTIVTKPDDLIYPTMEALKDREDVLIVATLVATDPDSDRAVPNNVRMAKFIPYDVLLPLVSLVVTNGGYGGVQLALRLGKPMVVAGEGQDKRHNAGLVDYAGVGISMWARSPPTDKLQEALYNVLDDPKYTNKAQEMSKKFAKYDMPLIMDATIQEIARKKLGN